MSFVMAYYSVTLVAILITHEAISPVNGQSTVIQGCDNGDHLISIVAEIQQLRVEVFDKISKEVQELKSQHGSIVTRLQAVDRRLEEHDISIRNQTRNSPEEQNISGRNQTQNSRTFENGSCGPASDVCDCSDIKTRGHTRSGVYEVCVRHQLNRTCSSAFCDMETDNRPSLVFQRRKDGSVNFIRPWSAYRAGFGNPNGEFWLGNEMLYLLTSKRKYKLRVELEDWEGEKRYAEYSNFSISSSADNYRLTVGGYSGNAGDNLDYHNGQQFSTIDADNDEERDLSCARMFGGAWWQRSCSNSALNAKYYQRYDTVALGKGISWGQWKNIDAYSLKATEMKLLPVS